MFNQAWSQGHVFFDGLIWPCCGSAAREAATCLLHPGSPLSVPSMTVLVTASMNMTNRTAPKYMFSFLFPARAKACIVGRLQLRQMQGLVSVARCSIRGNIPSHSFIHRASCQPGWWHIRSRYHTTLQVCTCIAHKACHHLHLQGQRQTTSTLCGRPLDLPAGQSPHALLACTDGFSKPSLFAAAPSAMLPIRAAQPQPLVCRTIALAGADDSQSSIAQVPTGAGG
jgi:hypothetical protein